MLFSSIGGGDGGDVSNNRCLLELIERIIIIYLIIIGYVLNIMALKKVVIFYDILLYLCVFLNLS